jgi:hypothetical protein
MSLESSIELLAQAINNLAAAQSMSSMSTEEPKVKKFQENAAIVSEQAEPASGTRPNSVSSKAGETKKSKEAPTTLESSEASVQTTESSSPEPSYEDVRKQILAIAGKKSRDKVVALLSRYGAKNGQELKPAQYVKFLADGERVLSGDYDPEAGE